MKADVEGTAIFMLSSFMRAATSVTSGVCVASVMRPC
jgi:hypothetical protein